MKKTLKLTESELEDIVKKFLAEQSEIDELDYEGYKTSEGFQPLRDAIKKNQTVSVVFVKKDGTVRPMAIRRSLKSHVFSDRPKTDIQRNIQKTYDLKRFIDINAYIRALRELGDSESAAKISWRTVPLHDTLGFLAGGHFYDVREENEIMERFGEEVYNSLTPNMAKAVEAQQAQAEADLEQENAGEEQAPEEPINENKSNNMKRVVKLTNSELNKVIKKVLKEQEEQQFGTTGPAPEEIAGDAQNPEEGGEPNYEAFLSAAQELLGQGITIGNLVDKLCEAKEEPEPEAEPTEPDQTIPSDNQ